MKDIFYRQCCLKREIQLDGVKVAYELTSWLPENKAIKNKYLKLKRPNGKWEDGWLVISVGDKRVGEEEANAHSREYLYFRGITDV